MKDRGNARWHALEIIGAYGMGCCHSATLFFHFIYPHSTNPMSGEALGRVAVLDIFEVRMEGDISSVSLVKNTAKLP